MGSRLYLIVAVASIPAAPSLVSQRDRKWTRLFPNRPTVPGAIGHSGRAVWRSAVWASLTAIKDSGAEIPTDNHILIDVSQVER